MKRYGPLRVMDDRSLNGVFVNGQRVEWQVLHDGDEIVVGRYRLHFLEQDRAKAPTAPLEVGGEADPAGGPG